MGDYSAVMEVNEIGFENAGLVHLLQNRVQWRSLVDVDDVDALSITLGFAVTM
jgi:hypothetical protein